MTSTPEKIIFDVDNVLADSIGAFIEKIKLQYDVEIDRMRITNPKLIGSVNLKPNEIFEMQTSCWKDYRSISLLDPEIIDLLVFLKQERYEILIASSSPRRNWENMERWLKYKGLVYDSFHGIPYGGHKSAIDASYLVDDSLDEIYAFIKNLTVGILFAQPWNQSYIKDPMIYRISTVNQILSIVKDKNAT